MISIFVYVVFLLLLLGVTMGLLEIARRRAIEKIKVSTYNAYLSYYEGKIAEFCKDKGDSCKDKLYNAFLAEFAKQVSGNKIGYIDIEELFKKVSENPTE